MSITACCKGGSPAKKPKVVVDKVTSEDEGPPPDPQPGPSKDPGGSPSKTKSKKNLLQVPEDDEVVKENKDREDAINFLWSTIRYDQYLEGYPDQPDDPEKNKNIQYYRNKKTGPDGRTLSQFHMLNFFYNKDYDTQDDFMEWLFPLREEPMNLGAQMLYPHEIEVIKSRCRSSAKDSLKVMLEWYGLQRKKEAICSDVYVIVPMKHAVRSFKQIEFTEKDEFYMHVGKIMRVLMFLEEVGHRELQVMFLSCLADIIYRNNNLKKLKIMCERCWLPLIKDDETRQRIEQENGMQSDLPEIFKGQTGV